MYSVVRCGIIVYVHRTHTILYMLLALLVVVRACCTRVTARVNELFTAKSFLPRWRVIKEKTPPLFYTPDQYCTSSSTVRVIIF